MEMSLCLSRPHPLPQLKWRQQQRRGCVVGLRSSGTEFSGQHLHIGGGKLQLRWSFLGGRQRQLVFKPAITSRPSERKAFTLSASWLTNYQIANIAFTCGTVAVLPFYSLMVLVPNNDITKRTTESSVPYVMLGLLYAYLLYLSWSPDTLRFMFASKYWLPELPGITRMFSNEITVASAWIHLLAVDLFAARQVFHDGLKNKIETRHSVSLCLLFCPVGILVHAITKALTKTENQSD